MKARTRSLLAATAVTLAGLTQFSPPAAADDPPPVVLGPPLASDGTIGVWQLPRIAPYNEAGTDASGKTTMHVYLTKRAAVAHNVLEACNAAPNANRFHLRGTGSNPKFRVRYSRSGTNVTASVVAGTFVTPRLAENACIHLRMRVTRTTAAQRGDRRRFTLTLTAMHAVYGPAAVSVLAKADAPPPTT